MSNFLLSVWFVLSMWFGSPAPATVALLPDNGDEAMNIHTNVRIWSLSDHEVEVGASIGILELVCSQNGESPVDGYTLTTSGGQSVIYVSDCADLISSGGATYQVIETAFPMLVTCNADCEVYTLHKTFESDGLTQQVGKIWVRVIGPDPQLIVTGK